MIKNYITATPILFALLLCGLCAFPESADAIPAFTRAHNVECTTCHTIFPELNEYGEAFLKNGYVFFGSNKKKTPEKSKAATEAKPAAASGATAVVKGDGDATLLTKLKAGTMISADAPASAAATPAQEVDDNKTRSEGLLISGIPEQLPISFSANIHGTYDKDAVNEFDFSTRALKLNAGGNFKEKVGFFGTYILYTENSAGISNTSQTPTNMTGKDDIVELFVIGRHIFDTPINIKAGRLQPKLGLWKSNNKLSITNSYATYAYTVGSSSFRIEQPQDAIEANMLFGTRIFLAGGVVNRKNQNTKEWYLHSSVKVGGADYLVNEPEIDLSKEESIFDFLTLTVGGYGYMGTNGDPNTVAGATPRQNDFYRVGLDIDLIYKLYRLKMSGVIGNDDNPDLTYTLPEVKSYVAAIEGQYTIRQNLIAALRFEYQDDGTNIVRRYIPTIAYAPIENLKLVAEYKQESGTSYKTTGTTDVDNKIGTLGVTFGF